MEDSRICVQIENTILQNILCSFVHEKCTVTKSTGCMSLDISVKDQTYVRDDLNIALKIGCGMFDFTYNSVPFTIEKVQNTHAPVSTINHDREAAVHEYVQLFARTTEEAMELVKVSQVWQKKKEDDDKNVQIYRWCANNEYWRHDAEICKRAFDTIILDRKVKTEILEDVLEFTSQETMMWYKKHCIPFKRGYLLHGPPGTGKTSIIHGIGSLLSRNIYKINLVAPKLCDDSLQMAVNKIVNGSIIVMEDIDALFGVHREKTEMFNVTFSGLLNAIDGICDTRKGTLFIFTTNHPEKLDTALKRRGRVDMQFHIGYCTREQMKQMFLRFYPEQYVQAERFAENHKRGNITTAQLQHHFILKRKYDATNAASFMDMEERVDDVFMWS